jgi:hypothetical protein
MNKKLISVILTCFTLCLSTLLSGRQNQEPIQNTGKNSVPEATICGVFSGTVEKDSLMKAGSLVCSGKNYEIVSFKMFRYADELKSTSNILTEEMKKCIIDMRSGSKLCFLDIIAKSHDGKVISLNPIILKIK